MSKYDVNPLDLRKKLDLNQQDFWSKFGITQSGGSRYEAGRNIPKPVRLLLSLYAGKISVEDLQNGKAAARL